MIIQSNSVGQVLQLVTVTCISKPTKYWFEEDQHQHKSTLHQPGHLDSNRYTSKVHAIHQHRRGRTASKLLIGVLICTVGAVFVLLAFHCMHWKESPNNSHEQHPDQHHDHDGQIQNFRIDQQHFPRPIPSQANSALKQESEFPTADAFDANTKQTLTLLPHLLSVINQ